MQTAGGNVLVVVLLSIPVVCVLEFVLSHAADAAGDNGKALTHWLLNVCRLQFW